MLLLAGPLLGSFVVWSGTARAEISQDAGVAPTKIGRALYAENIQINYTAVKPKICVTAGKSLSCDDVEFACERFSIPAGTLSCLQNYLTAQDFRLNVVAVIRGIGPEIKMDFDTLNYSRGFTVVSKYIAGSNGIWSYFGIIEDVKGSRSRNFWFDKDVGTFDGGNKLGSLSCCVSRLSGREPQSNRGNTQNQSEERSNGFAIDSKKLSRASLGPSQQDEDFGNTFFRLVIAAFVIAMVHALLKRIGSHGNNQKSRND